VGFNYFGLQIGLSLEKTFFSSQSLSVASLAILSDILFPVSASTILSAAQLPTVVITLGIVKNPAHPVNAKRAIMTVAYSNRGILFIIILCVFIK
jgi:hypothetical protein